MRPDLRVALLGTGIMGEAMGRRLLAANFDLLVWNRTQARARAVQGARIATTLDAAVDEADIVITMLSDAEATEAVMLGRNGALRAMKGDATWLQMATIGPRGTEVLAKEAERHGIRFVDAPVLGSRPQAEAGELVVLAAGEPATIERCRPLLDTLARRTIELGTPGQAAALKLAVNAWLVNSVHALAESIALARALGLDPEDFLGAIAGGPLDMAFAQWKGRAMIAGEHAPAFPLKHALKDALLAQAAHLDRGLEPRALDAAIFRLGEAAEAGLADADLSALFEVVRKDRNA